MGLVVEAALYYSCLVHFEQKVACGSVICSNG